MKDQPHPPRRQHSGRDTRSGGARRDGRSGGRDRDRFDERETTHVGGRGQNAPEPRAPKPPRPQQVLPDPEVLEAYDYIVEGSAKEIIGMFKAEQQQRHQWENRALRVHSWSTILGQLLGFFIAVSIFVSAGIIGMHGDATIGAFIWVFGMALVTMAALVWWYAKSLGQRPLFARPAMRASFRPEKEARD